jgi:hypothetical protein
MVQGITGFHHLGIITRGLADTVRRYEDLGFVFTPMSLPEFPLAAGEAPQPVGVANRNAVFRNGYLEMLGVVDAARWASVAISQRGPFDIDRPLQKYEGLHVMHFGTEDLDGVRTKLVSDGLRPSAIRPFQRRVETPEGTDLMRARCISFAPETSPEALFQIVQHETPQLALQPRFMTHRNGALTLSGAILCVEDPTEVAARYARYADRPVDHRGSLHIVSLDEARLVIIKPEDLPALLPGERAPVTPYFAGFTVTADLDRASTFLNCQAIPFQSHDGCIIVSARDACGSAIVFEQPESSQPSAVVNGTCSP